MDIIKILYLLGVVVFISMIIVLFTLSTLPENIECLPGDKDCMSKVRESRELCNPSTSIVTVGNSTNYIKLRITVYREGDKCITKEEVIEDVDSGVASYDITGYNNTCNLTAEELEKYGPHACQGSLFDFVAPEDSKGGKGFGGGTPESEPPHLYCTLEDDGCKLVATGYISTCVPSKIEGTESLYVGEGNVYLSIYVEISKDSSECFLYYKVINAVNLPPEIPPQVIGMDMTCTIPLSEFPIGGVEESSCSGPLIDYFELIY